MVAIYPGAPEPSTAARGTPGFPNPLLGGFRPGEKAQSLERWHFTSPEMRADCVRAQAHRLARLVSRLCAAQLKCVAATAFPRTRARRRDVSGQGGHRQGKHRDGKVSGCSGERSEPRRSSRPVPGHGTALSKESAYEDSERHLDDRHHGPGFIS